MSFIRKLYRRLLIFLINYLPKYEQAIVIGGTDLEGNAFEVADYIGRDGTIPVYYAVSEKFMNDAPDMFNRRVGFVRRDSKLFLLKYLTSRYVFFTHSAFLLSHSKRQEFVNLWHGILYKKIACLLGGSPYPADVTVGTSVLTRKMFAEALGVPESTVVISGYPRNDIMLRAKEKRAKIIHKINEAFSAYDKIIIWLPTHRKNMNSGRLDGHEVGNPFYIKDFDIHYFNRLLNKHNALCLLKPHPAAPVYERTEEFVNLQFINDKWLSDHKITLYHLLGCTDILISDVSSVMIDYLLLDQPIVCMSEDFEGYKQSRGFYFEDIENWIPSRINKNQESFFEHLEDILKNDADPSSQKREKLKNYFFDHQDANSTERLVKHVLENEGV